MTMIEIEAPATWDGVDAKLAELQQQLVIGTPGLAVMRAEVADIRADLAVLRAVERAQRGTPVVTRFLDSATGAPATPPVAVDPAPASNLPPPSPLATGREDMISSGYTGDMCDICGGVRMVRTGTCQTCQDCFAQTGCA